MPPAKIYLINPQTGRKILKHGPTHTRLLREGVKVSSKTNKAPPPQRQGKNKPLTSSHKTKLRQMGTHKRTSKGTHGWNDIKPTTKKDREKLYQKCKEGCFLYVDGTDYKFPICPKCSRKGCSCQIDCGGLTAAKIRASQYGYTHVRAMTDQLAKKHGWYKKNRISCL